VIIALHCSWRPTTLNTGVYSHGRLLQHLVLAVVIRLAFIAVIRVGGLPVVLRHVVTDLGGVERLREFDWCVGSVGSLTSSVAEDYLQFRGSLLDHDSLSEFPGGPSARLIEVEQGRRPMWDHILNPERAHRSLWPSRTAISTSLEQKPSTEFLRSSMTPP
jgi:hypothetical protein